MFQIYHRPPIVFGGPSLSHLPAGSRRRIELRPPARRGDLEALAGESRPATVVLVDGLFGGAMAVTPTECRHLLDAGWRVLGASSMGALRASELWSLGMIGVGDIYTLFRLGVLRSDADVAVAYDPDGFSELTISLVYVRSVLSAMERRQELSALQARKFLARARAVYWCDRTWERLGREWRDGNLNARALARAIELIRDPRLDPKKTDAVLAVHSVLAQRWVEH